MMTILLVMLGGPVLALAASIVTLRIIQATRSPRVQAIAPPQR